MLSRQVLYYPTGQKSQSYPPIDELPNGQSVQDPEPGKEYVPATLFYNKRNYINNFAILFACQNVKVK